MKKEPFRITVEHYDKKVIMEVDHSDVSMDDLFDMYRRLTVAIGYHPDTVDEYFGEDT